MSADLQLATPARRRLKVSITIAAFTLAFVVALFLDVPLSTWAHEIGVAGWLKNHRDVADLIRLPGRPPYTFAACAALLIVGWWARSCEGSRLWEKPAIVALAAAFSGWNDILKWVIGRVRPYHGVPPFELHPFRTRLLKSEESFSFPSGDASLAFAVAVSLSMVAPRLWPLWWTLAVIVGLERIAANAHYPSDVVAGAALGAAVAVAAKKSIGLLIKVMQMHSERL